MKTAEILAALNLCKSSLMSGDFVPILSHFCFVGDYVYSFNDISAVVVDLDTKLHCAVKGPPLLGILNTLGKEVALEQTDKGLMIKSGKTLMYLASLPESDMVFEFPAFDEDHFDVISLTPELIDGLKLCCETVGENAMDKQYTGIAFQIRKDGTLLIYSSDNVTVSRFESSTVITGKTKPRTVLLPAASVRQFIDLWEDGSKEDQRLEIYTDWVVGQFGRGAVVSKLMTEEPPDYAKVFEHVADVAWVALPAQFSPTLKRAEVLSEGASNAIVEFELKENLLKLSIKAALGSFTDEMKLKAGPAMKGKLRPASALHAAEVGEDIALTKRCLGFRKGDYTCLVSLVEE